MQRRQYDTNNKNTDAQEGVDELGAFRIKENLEGPSSPTVENGRTSLLLILKHGVLRRRCSKK